MNVAQLDELRKTLAAKQTSGLVIVRHDRIVYEWYAPNQGPQTPHYTASLAKAIVGGMSLLVAVNDRRLEIEDLASKYIPTWKHDPLKSRITIRQLATHSSGIEDAETPGRSHEELQGWKGAFWQRTTNPFSIALSEAPVLFEPGSQWAYSSTGFAALGYAVTASLKGTRHSEIYTLLKKRIMDPIGVPINEWGIGYGQAHDIDGMKLFATWGGGSFTPRAIARVGQLMLHKGNWKDHQLIDGEWVEKAVSPATTVVPDRSSGDPQPATGLGWYTNVDAVWPALPRDAFAGAGAGSQILLVVPSLDLVLVRTGETIGDSTKGEGPWRAFEKYVFNPLMQAIVPSPYPRSDVIGGVAFAPESSIIRKAIGSDNWPITWGADDAQYAAYGDGWGFEPHVKEKLSLGFSRIRFGPSGAQGMNIRSVSGERQGDGERGAKASGILMIDGVLYMWVRNVDNSQLAWSEDLGKNWTWGFKLDKSFGCPTFLNFGRDYQGARDEFVYTYSLDGSSCYHSYDQLVMARVQKQKIRDRRAYEFFQRMDGTGRPIWTKDIDLQGAVFEYRGRIQRIDAVYHPGIKRYLLTVGFGLTGGGWGIFDAPEPWGPWSTAFITEHWGLGDTQSYRLPSKWINDATMYLVFSGREHAGTDYDAFCVRKLFLQLN
jgi:CubicO group peptidase (beta-lactamase class C family)